jgi:putative transposase
LVRSSQAGLYAWALMPNHAHVLLRTGTMPLSRLALRWLGPYAGAFNRTHRRVGYLFQNRFKSILVEADPHFLELVRYIHLNPVRSRLPVNLDLLDQYPWTGQRCSSVTGHSLPRTPLQC